MFAELFTKNLFSKICLKNIGNNLEWKGLAEITGGGHQDSNFVVL